jgi:signal transduction histidine kinase
LDLFSNPVYELPPLISFLVLVVLIVLVIRGVKRSLSIQLFCGMLVSAAIWSLLIFFMRASSSTANAFMWEKEVLAFYSLNFVLFYHFTVVHTRAKGQNLLLAAVYLFLLVVIILIHLNLVILNMSLDSGKYILVMGPSSYILALINVAVMVIGAYNLLNKYKTSNSYDERNQLLYLSIALCFPLIGAFLDAFSDLHPVAIWGNLIFCFICSLAIIRYHLFDIFLVLKKSLAYILFSTMIALPFIVVMILINHIVYKNSPVPWWVYVILILIFSLFLRPFYGWLQNNIDRLFNRQKYDLLEALKKFDIESQNIDNLEVLSDTICRLVKRATCSPKVFLFLNSINEEGLVSPLYDQDNMQSGLIERRGVLVEWLKNHPVIAYPFDFDKYPELLNVSQQERSLLNLIDARLIVRVGFKDELAGVMVLGPKSSDREYTQEDQKMLENLTGHFATRLENTVIYRDVLRMRDGLNFMSDSVFTVSPANKILFMNLNARKNFGDLSGKDCWLALGRESKCPLCPIKQLRNNITPSVQTIKVGEKIFNVAYGPYLDPAGSPSVIEVLRDITEQKRIETEKSEYERKAQIASRLATVGEMAAGIAHEINNPLTAVIGYAELLVGRRDLPEEVKQDLNIIDHGAQRVANIVRRLMLFSRQSKPMRDLINVNDLIQTTLELSAYQIRSHGIKVIKNIEKDVPQILADGGQLQQVFLNLISNAESEMFTTHGKGILVITIEKEADNLLISFKDDGGGIPKENMQKLFQPFFTTKPVGKGTGLGLSICHGIVLEHKGRIWAESEYKKGATFFVEIPIMQPEELEIEDVEPDKGVT